MNLYKSLLNKRLKHIAWKECYKYREYTLSEGCGYKCCVVRN